MSNAALTGKREVIFSSTRLAPDPGVLDVASSFINVKKFFIAGSPWISMTGYVVSDFAIDWPTAVYGTYGTAIRPKYNNYWVSGIAGEDVAGFGRLTQLAVDGVGNIILTVDEGGQAYQWWVHAEYEALNTETL